MNPVPQDRSNALSPRRPQGRPRGKCVVSPEPEVAAFLSEWIAADDFAAYERPDCVLNHGGCRPRNRLYEFRLPQIRRKVVMKVSRIDPRYRLSRKIDLFVTGLYKDYNEVGFHGATALHAAGLPVAEPLAFWTRRRGLFDKRSYFLYRKTPGQTSVGELLRETAGDVKDRNRRVAEKLVAVLKRIHAANLRHGDFHTNNVQMHFPRPDAPGKTPKEIAEDVSDAVYYLLDYDKVSKAGITAPWIKKIRDLKDLSLLFVPGVGDEELLEMYLGEAPPPRWSRVFRFWRNGGFNLSRRRPARPASAQAVRARRRR